MLTSDRAADTHTEPQDFLSRLDHPVKLVRIALVTEHTCMEIADPGVEAIADADAVLCGYLADLRQDFRQLAARYAAVLRHDRWRKPPGRSDPLFAGDPEAGAVLRR